jgi:hypothetical protein
VLEEKTDDITSASERKKEKKNSYGAHHDASVVLWRGL